MPSFNKVILMGNLTRDPEIRYTQGGMPICNFNIAVNDGFGEKQEVLFIKVSTFNKQAENCSKFLKKGKSVLVDGRLKQNVWEKDDGTRQVSIEVNASNITFLSSPDLKDKKESEKTVDTSSIDEDVTEDSIPF